MKISVSVGTSAKTAFDRLIDEGVVTGIALDGHTLTFDYVGLSQDDALQRAVDNHRAVTDKITNAEGDELKLYTSALGFLSVATVRLAEEQRLANQGTADEVAEATMPELTEQRGDASLTEEAPSPAPSRRSRKQDADTTEA